MVLTLVLVVILLRFGARLDCSSAIVSAVDLLCSRRSPRLLFCSSLAFVLDVVAAVLVLVSTVVFVVARRRIHHMYEKYWSPFLDRKI